MSKQLFPVWSQKHKDYMQRAVHSTISVAEGAVRSGKTVDNSAVFARMIDLGVKDRIHIATGVTVASAKTIIGDCNGFGLEHIFRGRCKWGKYKDNEALYITSHGRQYIVLFVGGGKADSLKKIRGYSIGMWIATEINLHHPDFVQEVFNRQLAAHTPRVYWDLNPSAPGNWIYKDYIDKFAEQYGEKYAYEHFTITDNASLTKEKIEARIKQYEPGSIWYKRDILGIRCNAEGLIYPMFGDSNIIDASALEFEGDCFVSCDYGIQNATVFLLWQKEKGKNRWICRKEYYYSGRDEHRQKTDAELVEDLRLWLNKTAPKQVIVDPSAASLIVAMRKAGYKVLQADNDVKSGIAETAECLRNGYVCFDKTCRHLIEEMGIYSWDPAACEKGEDKPLKENDHCEDAARYFIKTKHILRICSKQPTDTGGLFLL